jgi:hypothetical protein
MTDQAALFEQPEPEPDQEGVGEDRLGPFARRSETSRQAAIDNYPRSGTQRRRVYDAIVLAGQEGYTREALAAYLDMPLTTVLPRVTELKRDGLVVDTSRTRTTISGSKAAVLVAVSVLGEAT